MVLIQSHILPGIPQKSATKERIHQVLGNLVQKFNLHEAYEDDADSWMGILAAAAFAVCSMYHQKRGKSAGQLMFGRDMNLPIKHIEDWKYICQRRKARIENI